MNQLMLQRNEMSTLLVVAAGLRDSPITVPNQPNSMTSSTQNPTPARPTAPPDTPLNQNAAPVPISSSANDPMIGQCDGCGTK